MDLNKQLFDHQLALIRAGLAPCTARRTRYETRANDIARGIKRYQRTLGARMPALLPAGCGAAA